MCRCLRDSRLPKQVLLFTEKSHYRKDDSSSSSCPAIQEQVRSRPFLATDPASLMTTDTWQMSQLILLSFVVVLDTDHHRVLIPRLENLAQGDGIALEQLPFTLFWSCPESGDGQLFLCLRVLSCEFSKGSLMLLQLFHICMKSLQICETIWKNYYTWCFVWFPADSETMVTGLNQYWQK